MRQAGVIAAAALYAVEHHVNRLAEDHANAQVLAAAIRKQSSLKLIPEDVQTNLVRFHIDPAAGEAATLVKALDERGVRVHPLGSHTMRACTHLDASAADVRRAAEVLGEVMKTLKKPAAKAAKSDHG
jgi:threonine aldolase